MKIWADPFGTQQQQQNKKRPMMSNDYDDDDDDDAGYLHSIFLDMYIWINEKID